MDIDTAGGIHPLDFRKGMRETEEAGQLVPVLLASSVYHYLLCGKSIEPSCLYSSLLQKQASLLQLPIP